MKKRMLCLVISITLILGYMPAASAASQFTDVPANHWAQSYIDKACSLGIIEGYGHNLFGLGDTVTRAQFAAMLVRLFGWEKVSPSAPSFDDNADKSKWYYAEIETAVKNGAVLRDNRNFRPNDSITREDMAVMLVRALGYDALARNIPTSPMPFSDVNYDVGYIMLAYDFGIIDGIKPNSFSPNGYATREQAAAMMIRLYEKYTLKTDWLHGFYAISSYSQKDYIPDFDDISFGWSRLEYSEAEGVRLNTTSAGGNEYAVPSGYETVVDLSRNSGVKTNLSVHMDASQTLTLSNGTATNVCKEILLEASRRNQAADAIADEISGNDSYSGVTIDFELLRGQELRSGFTEFLKLLRSRLNDLGATLYVCVHPATADGSYYDGYDFKEIGRLSDKVILMAHDYQALTLSSELRSAGFTTTPLTPFPSIYYALKAITDSGTGVEDRSKIALALSFGTVGWSLKDGKVVNANAMRPEKSDIYSRLINPSTVMNYSNTYQNPYITYFDAKDGTENIVWYEDERSVQAKLTLAHMFGVTGVSVWRLGIVPDYMDTSRATYYNVMNILAASAGKK